MSLLEIKPTDSMRKERFEEGLIFKIQDKVSLLMSVMNWHLRLHGCKRERDEVVGSKRRVDQHGQQQSKSGFKMLNFGGTHYNQGWKWNETTSFTWFIGV